MSESIGFDITPDSGTTLRKMLKNNLDPVLEVFEGRFRRKMFVDFFRSTPIRIVSVGLF